MSDGMKPSEKQFGFFFSGIFLLASFYLFFFGKINFGLTLLLLAVVFFTVALLKPNLLKILNIGWFNFGLLLGAITRPIVIGAIFFLMITPLAFFMRICGRDVLLLRSQGTSTYWIERSFEQEFSFKNQF